MTKCEPANPNENAVYHAASEIVEEYDEPKQLPSGELVYELHRCDTCGIEWEA